MTGNHTDFTALAQQYRKLITLCKQLESKNIFLRQRMAQLGNISDPRIRAVVPLLNAQLRQLDERMCQAESRIADMAHLLDSEILQLHNERLELILRCRYLELMTWDEISEATGLGLRWLHRLHNKGIGVLMTIPCPTFAPLLPSGNFSSVPVVENGISPKHPLTPP